MKRLALGLAVLLALGMAGSAPAEDLKARAARLVKSAIVVDTHEDVPEQLEKEWVDIGVRQKTGHVDIPRWKEGGVTAPFLAAYVSSGYSASGGSPKKALEFMDLIHQLAESHPELVFADSVAGIRAAKKNGRIAVLIGIEGGHAIEDSLGALSAFYRLGARYMTLTHTNTNHWADSAGSFFTFGFDPKKSVVHDGLTDFGREVVLEMNRLGMLVDISHVSDKTLSDVLEVSKAPVFASHSSCRALADMPRNLTDGEIKAIGAKGGVVMINFSSTFLDQKVVDDFKARKACSGRTSWPSGNEPTRRGRPSRRARNPCPFPGRKTFHGSGMMRPHDSVAAGGSDSGHGRTAPVRPDDLHLRHLLFPAHRSNAQETEEVAGDAGQTQEGGRGRHAGRGLRAHRRPGRRARNRSPGDLEQRQGQGPPQRDRRPRGGAGRKNRAVDAVLS